MHTHAASKKHSRPLALPRENEHLFRAIETLRGKPLLSIYLADEILINDDCILPIYRRLEELKPLHDLDIFLYSRGGTTETPWKIVSMIRDFTPKFSVLIPYRAHSAATHLSLGADELVMGPISELSPVDPTRMHPLLPTTQQGDPIPVSVQDLRHCLSFLRQEFKQEYSDETFATIYTKLFEFINPLALGAIEQSYRLARLISYKILTSRLDPERDKKVINRVIEYLSSRYQSHNYPIHRKEAREELWLPVTYPDDALWSAIWDLYSYYREESAMVHRLPQNKGRLSYGGFIETSDEHAYLQQVSSLEEQLFTSMSWIECVDEAE
ncbi:MAG: hypothetical protein WCP97_05135 [bacterium]